MQESINYRVYIQYEQTPNIFNFIVNLLHIQIAEGNMLSFPQDVPGLGEGQGSLNDTHQGRDDFPKGTEVDIKMRNGILDEENKNNYLNPMREPSHIHQ